MREVLENKDRRMKLVRVDWRKDWRCLFFLNDHKRRK